MRLRQIVDELDDDFRQLIGGRGLAGEKEGARGHVEIGVLAQPVIENDDPQRIEQLALVFVNALDLAIEDRVRIDGNVRMPLDPVGEPGLGHALGFANIRPERSIVCERPKLLQLRQIGDPGVADGR